MPDVHLKEILEPLWSSKLVSDTFGTLLDLFTEIHVFNYVHWKRDEPEFEDIRARYAVILFQFTLQLRYAIPEDQIGNMDAMYTHKVFGHSTKLFKSYNLAACSCEQGEGIISVINDLFRQTSGSYEARLRKLFLHLTMFEEQKMSSGLERDKSVVFQNFFAKYAPPALHLSLNQQEYDSFVKLFEYCDLLSDNRPVGVLLYYDRNRERYRIDCAPDSMRTMLRISTSRDGTIQAPIERSTTCLRVHRDRLPTPFIKDPRKEKNSRPKEPILVRLYSRLKILLGEIDDQLGLLSRGLANFARSAISCIDDLRDRVQCERWSAKQGEPCLASALELLPQRASWTSAFDCKESSKPKTRQKKAQAKEAFEREVLSRPWIQEISDGFGRSIRRVMKNCLTLPMRLKRK